MHTRKQQDRRKRKPCIFPFFVLLCVAPIVPLPCSETMPPRKKVKGSSSKHALGTLDSEAFWEKVPETPPKKEDKEVKNLLKNSHIGDIPIENRRKLAVEQRTCLLVYVKKRFGNSTVLRERLNKRHFVVLHNVLSETFLKFLNLEVEILKGKGKVVLQSNSQVQFSELEGGNRAGQQAPEGQPNEWNDFNCLNFGIQHFFQDVMPGSCVHVNASVLVNVPMKLEDFKECKWHEDFSPSQQKEIEKLGDDKQPFFAIFPLTEERCFLDIKDKNNRSTCDVTLKPKDIIICHWQAVHRTAKPQLKEAEVADDGKRKSARLKAKTPIPVCKRFHMVFAPKESLVNSEEVTEVT